jgi:hypothetical protein
MKVASTRRAKEQGIEMDLMTTECFKLMTNIGVELEGMVAIAMLIAWVSKIKIFWRHLEIKSRKKFNLNSKDFLDDDIADDIKCAKKIYNRHRFEAWYGWKNNCKGKDISRFSINSCF